MQSTGEKRLSYLLPCVELARYQSASSFQLPHVRLLILTDVLHIELLPVCGIGHPMQTERMLIFSGCRFSCHTPISKLYHNTDTWY